MARTFKITNFDKYQHYKDRDPPWVKLYRDTLTGDSWLLGTDLSRLVQVAIMMIAPRYTNEMPCNWTILRKVLNLDCTEGDFMAALDHLVSTNFVEYQGLPKQTEVVAQVAIKPPAKCTTEDIGNIGEHIEDQTRSDSVADATASGDDLDLPANLARGEEAEAVKIYNRVAQQFGWSECQKITNARKSKIKARLRDCGGPEGWRVAMERAGASRFLRGESKRGKGHENWKPDLDFFLSEEKFTQLMEGKYDDRSSPQDGDDDLRRQVLEGSGLAPGLDGERRPAA